MTTQVPTRTVPFVNQPDSFLLWQNIDFLLIVGSRELFDSFAFSFEPKEIVVQHASTAGEVYQRMNEFPAELIISEIGLPDESGWLMAAKLQISHPDCQVWLHTESENISNNGWCGMPFANQLICTNDLFPSTVQKCS